MRQYRVMQTRVAITGAASGLGRVIARELLAHGQPVVLVDRDGHEARATSSEFSARYGTPVPTVVADLSSNAGIRSAADLLIERSDIGALVNNAGGWLPGDQYPEAAPDMWLSAITLNLVAPMLLTQLLWPSLSVASGAVVNIGSSGGVGDDAYGSPEYGAAKAGIRRFTSSLASRTDVRVMAVIPGWIGLGHAHQEWASLSPQRQREAGSLIPPEDVASVVAELLSRGRPGEVVEILHTGERKSTTDR